MIPTVLLNIVRRFASGSASVATSYFYLKEGDPLEVGFYDPLKLSEGEFWGDSNEATIGWIRQVRRSPPGWLLVKITSKRKIKKCIFEN